MKKILYIICMAVAMSFASCQDEIDMAKRQDDDRAVAFSTESIAPLTRVTGTSWDDGDAIGITMVSSDSYTIHYDNIKYFANQVDTKVSFNPDSEVICYPEDGSEVCFIAFYPYQESWSYENGEMIFDISAQDGTQEAQSLVDLLLSPADTNQSSGEYTFEFEHFLSKVQITVSNYDELSLFEDLNSLTATLNTSRTEYNVLDYEILPSEETKALYMVKTTDEEKAIFTAIIAPGAVNDEIIFTDGISSFTATLAIEEAVAGKLYSFTATVGDQGKAILELTGDGVTDWGSQGGTVLTSGIEIVDGIYQIYTAEQLALFAQLVNCGNTSINGKLMNDIDLNGSETNQWTPIGVYSTSCEYAYAGAFDGGNFKVSELYINDNSLNHQGLFGYTNNATIKDLGVTGSVTGSTYVGGVVGYANENNGVFANDHNHISSITNCYSTCTVSGTSAYVGGIAGQSFASISDCYNTGDVSGADAYTGGIVGGAHYLVSDCYNTGVVSSKGVHVGGIVGYGVTKNSITNCYNKGSKVSGDSNYVGGIAGYCGAYSITDCYNEADVSSEGTHAGGIVGYTSFSSSDATITNCYNIGSKVSGVGVFVGGIAGFSSNSISNCYNKADVSSGGTHVGGIAGQNSHSITNCYNIGSSVYGNGVYTYAGGIVGLFVGSGYVANCYNWADVTGGSEFIGGIAGMALKSTICYNAGSVSGTGTNVGGVIGYAPNSSTYCYFDSDKYSGVGIGDGYGEATGYSTADMQSARLLSYLNNAAYIYNETSLLIEAYAWKAVSEDYSVFDSENEPIYNDIDIIYDTVSEVYQIYTGDGLRAFADLVNGTAQSVRDLFIDNSVEEMAKYFIFGEAQASIRGKLMNSIDLGGESNEFTPIGNDTNKYGGTFDGAGFEVSGLYINQSSSDYQALFGNALSATITSLGVSGSVTGYNHVAGVVGYALSTNLTECYSSVTVSGNSNVGGVVGYISAGSITSCSNSGSVEGDVESVGGIVGYTTMTSVNKSYNTSSGSVKGVKNVGGVVGSNGGYVNYCYNAGSVDGETIVGGVVGTNFTNAQMTNNYNRGSVKGTSTVGGVVGYNGSIIKNCYSTVSVSGTTDIGGVAGYNNSPAATITNCYYNLTIYTSASAVGTEGYAYASTTAYGKTTADMTGGSFATSLSEWFMEDSEGVNDSYPILIWQAEATE